MATEIVFDEHGFEYEVRNELNIFDRPITDEDILNLTYLALVDFDFSHKDSDILSLCKNLEHLAMDTCDEKLDFLKPLTKLESFDIVSFPHNNCFDFSNLEHLKNLSVLRVSGGDISDMELVNTDALLNLPNLKELHFHEFGSVDLSPLRQMEQLEFFFCGYADEVRNIDALKYLTNLNHLELIDIEVDNLNFLDNFPDDIEIELSLNIKNDVDWEKLKRFKKLEVYDTYINGSLCF